MSSLKTPKVKVPKGIYAQSEPLDKARKPLDKYGAASSDVSDVLKVVLDQFAILSNQERKRVLRTVAMFFELES